MPAPGHPFGIAVEGDRVYVSTSAGDFFSDPANGGHKNSDGERVFTYDQAGKLLDTTSIATMPQATMGLFGLALDGNAEPAHYLYVADMNGRILRIDLNEDPATPELFSQTTLPGGWQASMWNDLVFDPQGNLYVPDDKPRIWRVTPEGVASIWFTDPRLAGAFPFAGGPLGGRIDPSGEWFYFTITVSGTRRPRAPGSCIGCGSSTRRPLRTSSSSTCSRSSVTRRAAPADRPRLRGVGQHLREPPWPQRGRGPAIRPARRRGEYQTRCSIRRGAWRSMARHCW